mgnify:CR=1 FL=1
MSESHSDGATNDRTETRRFGGESAPFTAADLIEGDRIDPALVARTLKALGERRSARPDAPGTQLAEATTTDRRDDIHTAILVDGETGVLVQASRHDTQNAWTQKEADWKVREIGERVVVESAEVAQDGNDEWDADNATEAAGAWANVVLQDRARGTTDYEDEVTMTRASSLTLREPYGPTRVHATIRLETAE